MVVYKVEKSNAIMLLQSYWDLGLKSLQQVFWVFFNIHIWLTPLLEKQVAVKSVGYVRCKINFFLKPSILHTLSNSIKLLLKKKNQYVTYETFYIYLDYVFPHFWLRDKTQEITAFSFGIFPIWNTDHHPVIENRRLVITYKQQH